MFHVKQFKIKFLLLIFLFCSSCRTTAPPTYIQGTVVPITTNEEPKLKNFQRNYVINPNTEIDFDRDQWRSDFLSLFDRKIDTIIVVDTTTHLDTIIKIDTFFTIQKEKVPEISKNFSKIINRKFQFDTIVKNDKYIAKLKFQFDTKKNLFTYDLDVDLIKSSVQQAIFVPNNQEQQKNEQNLSPSENFLSFLMDFLKILIIIVTIIAFIFIYLKYIKK